MCRTIYWSKYRSACRSTCGSSWLKSEWLPPATKLLQGNVFTRVCDSVHRWGRGSPRDPQTETPWTETTPPPNRGWILNGSVRERVSSSRTRFWTLPNLNSEVSTPKILLFSYWFFMQIGWTAFTTWISLGIRLCRHFQIKVRKCPNMRTLPN